VHAPNVGAALSAFCAAPAARGCSRIYVHVWESRLYF
jgi:hypothetical protein